MEQYHEEFEQIFNKKIKPLLSALEKQRIELEKLNWGNLIFVVGILGFGIFKGLLRTSLPTEFFVVMIVIGTLYSFAFYFPLYSNYRSNLKLLILTKILSLFGQFCLKKKPVVTLNEIKQCGVCPKGTYKVDDDVIVGVYNGIDISITETEITHTTGSGKSKRTVTDFRGLILKIKMNKNFKGVTTIIQSGYSKPKGLEPVLLEDAEFEKRFEVFSNDQVEARYLITPSFMERFKKISDVVNVNSSHCIFKEGEIILFLGSPQSELASGSINGFFEFEPKKGQTLYDKSIYYNVISQMLLLFEFINHFKLDQKTGL